MKTAKVLGVAVLATVLSRMAFAVTTTNFLYSSGIIDEPRTSYWKGVAYDMTAATSWADGQRPGRFRDTMQIFEDGELKESIEITNGVYGSTMIFDGKTEDGGHRTGNYYRLDGNNTAWDNHPPILSYKNAIFTKGCLDHTFYSWRKYIFEAGGGIFVDEEAPHAPSFGSGASLIVVNCTTTNPDFFLRNDCLVEALQLQSTCWVKDNRSGGDVRMKIRFQGRGNIEFLGGWYEYSYDCFSWLSVEQTNDAKVVYVAGSYASPLPITRIEFMAGTGRRHFELQAGTSQRTWYDEYAIKAHTDVDLIGPGKFSLQDDDNKNATSPHVRVDPNCTIRCSACLANRGGYEKTDSSNPLRGLYIGGGGTFEVLDGMICTIEGTFRVDENTTVKTASIGDSDSSATNTPFGQNSIIDLYAGSKFIYTGTSAETTDRQFNLVGNATLATADTGKLTFAGTTGSGVLSLEAAQSTGTITIKGAVASGLSVADGTSVQFKCPSGSESLAVTPASFAINGSANITVDSDVTLTTSGDLNFGGSAVSVESDGAWVHKGGIISFDLSKHSMEDVDDIVDQLTLQNDALVGYDTSASAGTTITLTESDIPDGGLDFLKVGTGTITILVNETIESEVRIRAAGGKLILKGTGELKHATMNVLGTDATVTPQIVVDGLKIYCDEPQVLGDTSSHISTYYQMSGDVTSFYKSSAASGDRCVGLGAGYSYAEIAGGTYEHIGGRYFGASPSQAIIYQTGGDVTYTLGSSSFVFGNWDTQAILYHTGGTRYDNVIYSPWWGSKSNKDNEQVCSIITTEGSLATNRTASLYLGNWATGSTKGETQLSAYNVNDGGVLCCYSCAMANKTADILSGLGRAYLNFDGGVFLLMSNNTGNLFGSGDYILPQVTVFSGGMIFDMSRYKNPGSLSSATTTAPINGATGKGVVAVAIPDEVSSSTFAGPPAVCIIGNGEDASAVALWDRDTGKVTGVKITCPGLNYTSAKARWCYNGYTFRAESTVTLADNGTDGGLTVRGLGTLTLGRVNNYAGPTKIISPAKLALGASDQINASSPLVLQGGTLALGDYAQTFSDITLTDGGSVTGGKVTVTGLSVDFDEAKAGTAKTVDLTYCTFPAGAKLTLNNYEASKLEGAYSYTLVNYPNGVASLDCSEISVPSGWEFVLRGTSLVLRKPAPTMLIVK